MIKVSKDIDDIPVSLTPAFSDLFPNRNIPRKSKTTHKRRVELINNGAYIDHDIYNSRYKQDDVKEKLQLIYNGKCAFCEQRVEQWHVEHYRPKKTYYWLAYSWDNLILACPKCNENKGDEFELNGVKCTFVNNDIHLRNINNLSLSYNISERPKMINPEVTDPSSIITFSKDGKVDSQNAELKHTITTCKIDRNYLNDARRKILDTLKNEIRSELVYSKNIDEQHHAVDMLVRQFIRASKNKSNEFLGFRRYSIENQWIRDVIRAELI